MLFTGFTLHPLLWAHPELAISQNSPTTDTLKPEIPDTMFYLPSPCSLPIFSPHPHLQAPDASLFSGSVTFLLMSCSSPLGLFGHSHSRTSNQNNASVFLPPPPFMHPAKQRSAVLPHPHNHVLPENCSQTPTLVGQPRARAGLR